MEQNSSDDALANVAAAVRALRAGNFDPRMVEASASPLMTAIAKDLNAHFEMLAQFKAETMRVAGEVGTLGRLGGQAEVPDARGDWQAMVQHVNTMSANLTHQLRDTGAVVFALLEDRSDRRVTCGAVGGELHYLGDALNRLADKLAARRAPTTAGA